MQLLRFIPGNYLSDNLHRVELYNPGPQAARLDNWLLVTRDYVFCFPAGTTLGADRRLSLAKDRQPNRPVDIRLLGHPNFMIKLYSRKVEGNYCALLDARGQLVEGFYFAELAFVPFLPDSGGCYRDNQPFEACYRLPPEQSPRWKYLPVGYDPAVGFEQASGHWRLISARSTENLYPTTAFAELSARYREGAVVIRATTRFEDGLTGLILERGETLEALQPIARIETAGTSRQPQDYLFYDTTAQPNRTYYYRMRSAEAPGLATESKIVEVETYMPPVEFRLEVLYDERGPSVRYASVLTQVVVIKLLDERWREWAILHEGLVYADTPHLLRLEAEGLPRGRYRVVAATETRRYLAELIID